MLQATCYEDLAATNVGLTPQEMKQMQPDWQAPNNVSLEARPRLCALEGCQVSSGGVVLEPNFSCLCVWMLSW